MLFNRHSPFLVTMLAVVFLTLAGCGDSTVPSPTQGSSSIDQPVQQGPSDLSAAKRDYQTYLDALIASDWKQACDYTSERQRQITVTEANKGGESLSEDDCEAALSWFFADSGLASPPEIADTEAAVESAKYEMKSDGRILVTSEETGGGWLRLEGDRWTFE